MMSDAQPVRGRMMSLDQARGVLAQLGLSQDGIAPLRVRQASAARIGLPADADPDRPAKSACRLLWEHFPRLAAPGASLIARVRVQNTGGAALRSTGEGRAMIAARWSGPDGQAVKADDVRTFFSADLLPGQSRTMAARLRAPGQGGRYVAELTVVEEGIRWITPALARLPIQVRPDLPHHAAAAWPTEESHRATSDPTGDGSQLQTWLASLGNRPVLLEISADAVRPLSGPAADVVVSGDDLEALQWAALAARHTGRPANLLNAAAADLPFPPAFFDAVVVTAQVETWPDPVAGLRRIRSHLRPGGFVALFGQVTGGTDFEDDAGEGGLSQADFARLFRQSSLRPSTVAVGTDHRLSARLHPEEADLG